MLIYKKRLIQCNGKVIDTMNGGPMTTEELIQPWSRGAQEIHKAAVDGAHAIRGKYPNVPYEDLYINRMWSAVNAYIPYTPDAYYFDFWKTATETYDSRQGDCEDTAILLVSAARFIKFPVQFAIGYYVHGGERYGHGWAYYDSKSLVGRVVLETTWETEVTPGSWLPAQSSYHPTVVGDENGFVQACSCQYCQEMMEYLKTGADTEEPSGYVLGRIKWLPPDYKIQEALVESPKRQGWWNKLLGR